MSDDCTNPKLKLSLSDSLPANSDIDTSGISFEEDWEEDDLVALSGKPGQSFHKVFTGNASSIVKPVKLHVSDDVLEVDKDTLSEAEIDQLSTPDEIATSDGLDSMCSSPQAATAALELEWDNDTPLHEERKETSPVHQNLSNWRTVVIGEKNYKLDLSAVTPYRQVLSHGGYYGEGLNAIVVFSACYLPDAKLPNYQYVMDNLFLHIVSTLDLLVAEDYMIIFFNGGCSRKNFPALKWIKKCYQMIHRRLRKNLKELIIVHPTLYLKFIITLVKPFISSKFCKKLKMVPSLHRLADLVPVDSVVIPDAVQQFDIKLLKTGKSEIDSSDDGCDVES